MNKFVDEDNINKDGIFQGCDGLLDLDRVKEEFRPQGKSYAIKCKRCGAKNEALLEWPEIVLIAENMDANNPILPVGFHLARDANNAAVPSFVGKCQQCAVGTIIVPMPIQTARAEINNAVQTNQLSRDNLAQYKQRAIQAIAQYQRR